MRMVSIDEGMALTGHTKKDSFTSWVTRFNRRNPGNLIVKRWGKVDQESLIEALRRESIPADLRDAQ